MNIPPDIRIREEDDRSSLDVPAVRTNYFVIHIQQQKLIRLLFKEVIGEGVGVNRGAFIMDAPSARALSALLTQQADAIEKNTEVRPLGGGKMN